MLQEDIMGWGARCAGDRLKMLKKPELTYLQIEKRKIVIVNPKSKIVNLNFS